MPIDKTLDIHELVEVIVIHENKDLIFIVFFNNGAKFSKF